MISADGSCIVAQKMMYLNDSISATVVDQIQVQLDATTIEEVRIFYGKHLVSTQLLFKNK